MFCQQNMGQNHNTVQPLRNALKVWQFKYFGMTVTDKIAFTNKLRVD
jgi:hypothetical protein